jgi:hypothetical protein
MKQKFIVEVKFSAMNEMSLYERLRNAVFEWQTTEPKVRSVSVVPAPQNIKVKTGTSPNKQSDAICPKSAVARVGGKIICIEDGEDCTGIIGACGDGK